MRFCMDLCLAVVLIQIAWTDIRTMMIPDRVLVPLMILAGLSVPCTLQIFLWTGHLVAVISGCWQPQDSVSDGKHA